MNRLWRRMWSHSSDEPNRSHRRSLARMTRPDRAELHKIIGELKRLPLEQRADVVALLSEAQQEKVRKYL